MPGIGRYNRHPVPDGTEGLPMIRTLAGVASAGLLSLLLTGCATAPPTAATAAAPAPAGIRIPVE